MMCTQEEWTSLIPIMVYQLLINNYVESLWTPSFQMVDLHTKNPIFVSFQELWNGQI
jgi:hypothetical protein